MPVTTLLRLVLVGTFVALLLGLEEITVGSVAEAPGVPAAPGTAVAPGAYRAYACAYAFRLHHFHSASKVDSSNAITQPQIVAAIANSPKLIMRQGSNAIIQPQVVAAAINAITDVRDRGSTAITQPQVVAEPRMQLLIFVSM